MNRSELNTVFWPAISLWINTANNSIYATQPADYCTIGYDNNNDTIITDWIDENITEPTINDLLTYTVEQVNNYWDKILTIPQLINDNSNIYTFSGSISKNDIPTQLLNNGAICVDNSNVYILISGTWQQLAYV